MKVCLLILAWSVAFLFAAPSLSFAASGHGWDKTRCLDCHIALPLEGRSHAFHADISDICLNCHDKYPCKPGAETSYFSHPFAVVPSGKVPDDMPLDEKRRIGCMTCHVYHVAGKETVDLYPARLRRSPGVKLCFACHGMP